MRKPFTVLIGAAALVGATIAGPTLADDEGVIKYRQGVMKAVGGHTGALAQIMKGNVAHKAHAADHAQAMVGLSKMVTAAFKENAMGESRGKDNIWSDWSGFESKAADFEKAATALAAASGGSMDGFGDRMKDLFASCKGCHKEYRAKKK